MRDDGTAEVVILRTNSKCEVHHVGRHILLRWIKRMIGAEIMDVVNLRDGRVMIVDDAGWETETIQHPTHTELRPVRARKPINKQATTLYHTVCKPGTTHQIVGDVAVAFDIDFAGRES